MNRVILPLAVFLLPILTDRSGLATRVEPSVYYDGVLISIGNRATSRNTSLTGRSYPSRGNQDYPNLCDLRVYFPGSALGYTDCDDLGGFPEDRCTVVYYDNRCETELILLVRKVQRDGGDVVIYRTPARNEDGLLRSLAGESDINIPVILVTDPESEFIKFANEYDVQVNITQIEQTNLPPIEPTSDKGFTNQRSTTTFYFVVFAFTILLLLSLTWFIFNYLRRCHHMYTAKRRRAELLSKTRKAIEKCPTKTYKKPKKPIQKMNRDEDTDSVTSDDDEKCAICLETYKTKDILRILPCQHEFHKICIDPWLFEKGTCPMCKHNIVGNQECLNESTNRELRMLAMTQPGMLDLGSLEEGLENDSDDQRRDNDGDLQVEIIE